MAWTPINGTPPQYSTSDNALAGDYYLKFYASGTTTPINMATDSTGATQLSECALSSDGYPITNPLDDSTKFIPHIDQDYRIVLYTNKTDADNNTTANAAFNIDGIEQQVAPTANATDITLRDNSIQEQDDYDRSPLFVDGTDFTAGAGPHTITVPSGWTPTDADMRFYRLDSSGIVTPLTPTATSSTDFTLAETLLSTDVIFIGDDNFRNQFEGDPEANFDAIKQDATETSAGVVEEATSGEMSSGEDGKFPDAATIKGYYGDAVDYQTEKLSTSGSFTSGSCRVTKIGNMVTISGVLDHSSSTLPLSGASYIPAWAIPDGSRRSSYRVVSVVSDQLNTVSISSSGNLSVEYYDTNTNARVNDTSTGGFTISYCLDDL